MRVSRILQNAFLLGLAAATACKQKSDINPGAEGKQQQAFSLKIAADKYLNATKGASGTIRIVDDAAKKFSALNPSDGAAGRLAYNDGFVNDGLTSSYNLRTSLVYHIYGSDAPSGSSPTASLAGGGIVPNITPSRLFWGLAAVGAAAVAFTTGANTTNEAPVDSDATYQEKVEKLYMEAALEKEKLQLREKAKADLGKARAQVLAIVFQNSLAKISRPINLASMSNIADPETGVVREIAGPSGTIADATTKVANAKTASELFHNYFIPTEEMRSTLKEIVDPQSQSKASTMLQFMQTIDEALPLEPLNVESPKNLTPDEIKAFQAFTEEQKKIIASSKLSFVQRNEFRQAIWQVLQERSTILTPLDKNEFYNLVKEKLSNDHPAKNSNWDLPTSLQVQSIQTQFNAFKGLLLEDEKIKQAWNKARSDRLLTAMAAFSERVPEPKADMKKLFTTVHDSTVAGNKGAFTEIAITNPQEAKIASIVAHPNPSLPKNTAEINALAAEERRIAQSLNTADDINDFVKKLLQSLAKTALAESSDAVANATLTFLSDPAVQKLATILEANDL